MRSLPVDQLWQPSAQSPALSTCRLLAYAPSSRARQYLKSSRQRARANAAPPCSGACCCFPASVRLSVRQLTLRHGQFSLAAPPRRVACVSVSPVPAFPASPLPLSPALRGAAQCRASYTSILIGWMRFSNLKGREVWACWSNKPCDFEVFVRVCAVRERESFWLCLAWASTHIGPVCVQENELPPCSVSPASATYPANQNV